MARWRTKGSKHLILAKLLALLVLSFPLRTSSTFTDTIGVGFQSSAMTWVDTQGVFLNSKSDIFSLVLYSPPGEISFYLCVVHVASQQIVWTANRNHPVGQSDSLVFSRDGDVSLNHNASTIWSTNSSGRGVVRMQMQDSGNFVLLNASNRTLWQSFDYPTDTLLPGQALRSGMKLVSSITDSNLASGPYYLSFESGDLRLVYDLNPPELYWSLTQDSRLVKLAAGSATHAVLNVSGLALIGSDGVVVSQLHWSGDAFCRATLGSDGNFAVYVFSSFVWTSQLSALSGCSLPLICGSYGVCVSGQCRCPDAYQAVNDNNLTQGCQAPSSPPCVNKSSSVFSHYELVGKGLQYFANQFTLPSLMATSLDNCQKLCTQNCSCRSLFYYNESGSCYLYSELATIQKTDNTQHVLYVKTTDLPTPPPTPTPETPQKMPHIALPLIIFGSVLLIIVMVSAFLCWYFYVRNKSILGDEDADDDDFLENIPGLPARFSYKELIAATRNFSTKLGTGGFGSVYEGVLPDKTKIAVKKLESVGQGKKEFRAEVAIIGGIHHVHLVQLRGFCAEGVHRLLVYEFMSKSSLDRCLFLEGEETQVLDWNTRYNIALGTARGLAYLHDDCREKIIHCDIKPENILLDESFNAKVSDFGLAKLMNKEQSQVFTTLRGTRGYLAPEWLMNLAISEKSDVYSFGMVLLEIISGRKNFDPSETSEKWYFPAYAFQQAELGMLNGLVDARLQGFVRDDQVIKAVKVALWCIQEDSLARPSMGKVVQMLEGNVPVLPPPLSSQFAVRLHARMVEAMKISEKSSSTSDYNSREMLSAVQLSAPR